MNERLVILLSYEVIDFHCDALYKMQFDSGISFSQDSRLDVDLDKLIKGGVQIQTFAIYISERLGPARFHHVLDQLDIFNKKVAGAGVRPLCWGEDLDQLRQVNQPLGLLSIEGADGLEGNMQYLRIAFEQGVRFLGLTWNFANWAADGVMERRGAGFTNKGLELISECHRLGITLDISHLSVQGFWELVDMANKAQKPFIASHSNAYQICAHPRNLRDDQIQAIIEMDGRIGITFVPYFVKAGGSVQIHDLIRHIEHICSLGGSGQLMFGSDFDGIDSYITGLENPGCYPSLIGELLRYYPETLVKSWLFGNAESFLRTHLPKRKKTL
ncbi:dipeptidase [Paenibacillus tuaregi]|uniref:dipeptidase n=1 Tax=Paenibacillus tuaregi TaxID=1816681 RepID=UPI0008388F33|nr:membrane dipeptidase [Paenibacillus tuaregi]